ncbi:hypothetical protein [Algoriphagus sp.]|uniref:hypothetical protein n=1 Tax=Algoriphagus sp. TaxID=1872435 RepID=UPI0027226F53|nr:hypothetical protein [Algoriphagus sp.]MDO8965780.1 hypothetical protein [Algoriphagus sp.]MDP3198875.1 hypothetical protein [Algoriphagus sp.]
MKKPTKSRKYKPLIRPTTFQMSVNELRLNKAEIYNRMELQANELETIEFYKKAENDLSKLDLEIMEG